MAVAEETMIMRGSREIAFPKDGFIWDYCQRAGISYRSYGEFVNYGKTGVKSLEGHSNPNFPTFDLDVPDLKRFELWRADFDSLMALDALPRLTIMHLPNDHTAGAKLGMPTPRAMVAEHDLAFGKLIEHISKSKIWHETAIFVLEDDAQSGPDHVDAHRSIAFVVSPYAKRKTVVSRAYSTSAMLRTIELILGLPPMSQYDAAAIPMWECFTNKSNIKSFVTLPAQYNLKELNKAKTSIAIQSARFNFATADAAPDLEFNQVIWKAVKGMDSEMPAPMRSAFVKISEEEEEED